jgi:hypothetical protein
MLKWVKTALNEVVKRFSRAPKRRVVSLHRV